jgi:hypothetical protein
VFGRRADKSVPILVFRAKDFNYLDYLLKGENHIEISPLLELNEILSLLCQNWGGNRGSIVFRHPRENIDIFPRDETGHLRYDHNPPYTKGFYE